MMVKADIIHSVAKKRYQPRSKKKESVKKGGFSADSTKVPRQVKQASKITANRSGMACMVCAEGHKHIQLHRNGSDGMASTWWALLWP